MKLLKGFAITSAGNIIKIFAALLARTLMARLLGPVMYGGFGVGLNMATVLSRLLTFGLLPAAQYYGSKKEFDQRDHLRTSLLLGLVISLLITSVGVLLVPRLMAGYWARQVVGLEVFNQLAPFLGIIILGNVMGIIMIPWNRVLEYTIGQIILGVAVPLLFLSCLPLFLPLKAAVFAQIGVWVIALGYNTFVMRRELGGGRFNPELALKTIKYGLMTWPQVILNVGAARLAILLGANYLDQNNIGLFIVGMNISEAIFGFHASLGQLVLSRVSEEEKAAFKVTQQAMRLSVILLVSISLLYFIGGRPLLLLIFGAEYSSSWDLSLVLLITGGAHSLGRLSGSVLSGLGKPIRNSFTLIGEVVSLLVLIPLLTVRYGAMGLAMASAFSATVSLMVSLGQCSSMMQCSVGTLILPGKADLVVGWNLSRILLKTVGAKLGKKEKR